MDGQQPTTLATRHFRELLHELARAWSEQDTEAGLACFTEDADYREPPDLQYVQGHTELHPYFAALEPGTYMRFHYIWFDEAAQTGVGEYTFGHAHHAEALHGICVVTLRDGRIAVWREYQRRGPADFEAFIGRA